MSRLTSGV